MKTKLYSSERDIPLVCMDYEITQPTITVENYIKWYDLYLIDTDGKVATIPYELMEEISNEFNILFMGDHIFNPEAVIRLVDKHGWVIDDVSYEVIIGRWEQEMKDNYYF